MQKISREDYNEMLKTFLKEELEKSDKKPSGMFGNWAFRSMKEKEFKARLKEQNIEVTP